MNTTPDLYARLGVSRDATASEIHAAYRREAKRLHPDRNHDRDSRAMHELNEAWRILSEPSSRAAYDRDLGATGAVPRPDDRRPLHLDNRVVWRLRRLIVVAVLLVTVVCAAMFIYAFTVSGYER